MARKLKFYSKKENYKFPFFYTILNVNLNNANLGQLFHAILSLLCKINEVQTLLHHKMLLI